MTQVGEGMTGWVAETGRSLLTPNAQEVGFAVQIEGTDDIIESMLLVPTKVGDRVNGVIVLSSIGYGSSTSSDQQVVEVLAPHAAVAFENAELLAAEREAARDVDARCSSSASASSAGTRSATSCKRRSRRSRR